MGCKRATFILRQEILVFPIFITSDRPKAKLQAIAARKATYFSEERVRFWRCGASGELFIEKHGSVFVYANNCGDAVFF